METHIYIGADIVPTRSNYALFRNGDIKQLLGTELMRYMKTSDFTILNLETPLIDKKFEIEKCGPCFITPINTVAGLKAINPFFYTLANNHILDQGAVGLKSTIQVLRDNNIDFSGVGNNLDEAKCCYIKEINGIKLGIYCCVEHEFSIAGINKPGANPFDPFYSFDHIVELKKKVNLVIVLYHGGKEQYRYPSQELKKVFHKFAEVGADYVIAQHSHCIGCMEKYNGSVLIYGQGNFIFDSSNHEYWQTSILLKINVFDNMQHNLDIIPCVKQDNVIRKATDSEGREILKGFFERSQDILDNQFIEKKYTELAEETRHEYYYRLLGKVGKLFIFKVINKLTHSKIMDNIYTETYLPLIENCFACESHRELVTHITRLRKVDNK